jgi:hypothetical protein
VKHLGFNLNIPLRKFELTEKQFAKLQTKVDSLLSIVKARSRCVQKRALAAVIGYLQSTALAVPDGREHLVALYKDLN